MPAGFDTIPMSNVIPLPRLGFRRATRDDLATVAALVHAVWHETYGRTLPRPVVAARTPEHIAEEVAMRIDRGWLALLGTRLVGYCATSANCVEDLWVVRRYRRRGIGSALLERALGDLRERGYQGAQVGCENFNAPARHFFERHGWQTIGAEPQYYAAGRVVSALVYARALQAPAEG